MPKDWETAVQKLAEQVQGWVSKDLAERSPYVLHVLAEDPKPDEPILEIEAAGHDVLRLEPAAFAAGRVPTIVYLYAYPTLRRAVLVGPDEDDNWEVQSSEGVRMNYQWNRPSFLQLLGALAESHVPRRV